MNKACVNCGRIVTFPDIPLPKNYTQKCNACGYDNYVDEAPIKKPKPPEPSVDDSWSATFDSAVDQVFPSSAPIPKPAPSPPTNNPSPSPTSLKAPMVSNAQMEAALNQLREEMLNSFNQKLRSVEARMNNEASITREVGEPLLENDYLNFQREVRRFVAYREVLVCTQTAALIQTCETQLRDQGFSIKPLTNLDGAEKALSEKNYHVMILDQNFFRGEEGKALLTRIKQTPIEVRRCQVILLVSPNISSCEPQIFYQWGLDMNVHPRDLEKLGSMIRNLMNLRTQMLGPYLETPGIG